MSAPGEPPGDPLIGQVVDGRYHIRRIIGRGGMGVVYEAEATRLGRRPCAIKVLLPGSTASETAAARFTREAELVGRIKHPNVVEIFDTGTTAGGRGYIAMELLRGESLERTLRREGPLPWARAQHILIQICRALAVAHAENIVHRDMKPENCFRGERDGDPDFIKVLDFGIAKLTDTDDEDAPRLTATGAVIGTYAYMAHEQVRGETLDHRVDVWALGVMLYEMLTGRLPFRGSNQGQIWTAICSYDPEPMRNIAPQASIPEPAEAIVRRALARSRDDRYPTVEALARAIAEVQADGSARAVAGKTSAPGDLGPPAPLARSASPTFVSGPTAALEAPRQNSRTDPVSPHGLTELSAAEAVDTGETRHPTPRPTASEGRQPAPAPPREGMETAQIVVPIAPTPALMVATPPAPRGPRRTMWLLAGLGAPGIALALWLSRGTGVEPAPIPRPAASPVSSEQAKVMVPDLKAAEPVPIVTPEPEPEPAPSVMPEPEPAPVPILTPEPEPDPPKVPDKAAAPATSKPAVRYASRVTRALHILRGSASLADCFGTSTAPLLVDVEVGAATGAATVTLPALKRGSVLDICVQRVFQGTKFPVGGPGDADFESKKYVLNKQ